MDREIKIMVSSSVYGFENELEQIIAALRSYRYYVMNSHVGTIKVDPSLSNLENCLRAVEECDLFLGIIRPFMGTGNTREMNITFEEIKKAIELRKPYWFLVHRDVVFAYKLFKRISRNERDNIFEKYRLQWMRDRFFDPICINVYEHVINRDGSPNIRTSNWAQEFYRLTDMMEYIKTQFKDKTFIETLFEQED